MIAALVQTNAAGFFNLPSGSYTCLHTTDQVYITATQGNPGLASGTNNAALVMVSALGSCGNISSLGSVSINEVTTAAAAWALAPFANSYTAIGASATNSLGITDAMLNAQLLANPTTGLPPTLPSTLAVVPGKLYALADVLASCVNSDGATACQPLFTAATPTNGTAPADTFTAALNIVKNPGQNPSGVFNVIGGQPPYPTSLSQAPYDWTMSISVSGGGLTEPTALGIDASGNVWVGGEAGVLAEFSPQGAPLSGSGFGVGDLEEVFGLTIDPSGNIWVSNAQASYNNGGSIAKFLGSNSGTPGAFVNNGTANTAFYDSSIDYPVALSADTNGHIFIANYGDSTVTTYNSSGSPIATSLGATDDNFPIALAADSTHGVWIANNGDNTVTHVDQYGNILANPACCNGANGIAVDALGNAWVSNYYSDSFSEVSATGSILINGTTLAHGASNIVGAGYTSDPAGIVIDAAQNVWIANYRGESFSEVSGANSTNPGTMLSPAYGYGYSGAHPTNPLLVLPNSIAADASGNIWVADYGNNNVIMFLGLATPTVTPVQPIPAAP
jgi:hypothetical protein